MRYINEILYIILSITLVFTTILTIYIMVSENSHNGIEKPTQKTHEISYCNNGTRVVFDMYSRGCYIKGKIIYYKGGYNENN